MIKAVSFDLDDTLWNCKPVLVSASLRSHDFMHSTFPELSRYSLKDLQDKVSEMAINNVEISHDYTKIRKEILQTYALETGLNPSIVVPTCLDYFLKVRNEVDDHVYDGTIPLLQHLKEEKYIIASITNGNADVLKSCLSPYFDFHIGPSECNSAKPNKRSFETAFSLMKEKNSVLSPYEVVHVGDSYTCDIIGGKDFGFKTIWLNHNDNEDIHGKCDAEIKDISEVKDILKEWSLEGENKAI